MNPYVGQAMTLLSKVRTHIVGLFCPYSRSLLLTLVWSAQALAMTSMYSAGGICNLIAIVLLLVPPPPVFCCRNRSLWQSSCSLEHSNTLLMFKRLPGTSTRREKNTDFVVPQVSVSKIKEKSKLSKFQTLEASDEL
jgi:hypothetical protein